MIHNFCVSFWLGDFWEESVVLRPEDVYKNRFRRRGFLRKKLRSSTRSNSLTPPSHSRRLSSSQACDSAGFLLWAVSLRKKQHSVVFNLLHVILEDYFLLIREGLFEDLLPFAALVVVTVPLCTKVNYICSHGNIPSECVCRAIYPRSSFISFEFVRLSSPGMMLPCHSSFIMLSIWLQKL